jgi:hypothetical protein
MEAQIKRRNMILQVVWCILTFGIYAVYWFYATSREMAAYLKREENVMLWTIFFGFPFLFCYSYYKQSELYEEFSGKQMNRWILFVLWIVFPPAVWLIVQPKLNEISQKAQPVIA